MVKIILCKNIFNKSKNFSRSNLIAIKRETMTISDKIQEETTNKLTIQFIRSEKR